MGAGQEMPEATAPPQDAKRQRTGSACFGAADAHEQQQSCLEEAAEGEERLTFAEASRRSGWPQELLEDPARQPEVTDDPATFLSFVCYSDHSRAQMLVLRDGIRRLGLATSVPAELLTALSRHRDAVACTLAAIDAEVGGPGDGLDGDVFCWKRGRSRREMVKRGTLRSRLERARDSGEYDLVYIAELSRAIKTPHDLTGEKTRQLTSLDVRDIVGGELPMWDRGHCFVGGEGAGSCLHTDQACWSNVAKNFLGHKLVALWGPDAADAVTASCGGELFRNPLSDRQKVALASAAKVALLRPGDVCSFTGGLPHATAVVGDLLNFTSYESLVNFNPANAELLLQGARRPQGAGVMSRRQMKMLLDDVADACVNCQAGGRFPAHAGPPRPPWPRTRCTTADGADGDKEFTGGKRERYGPMDLLVAFQEVLTARRRCARTFAEARGRTATADVDGAWTDSSSASSRSPSPARARGLDAPAEKK